MVFSRAESFGVERYGVPAGELYFVRVVTTSITSVSQLLHLLFLGNKADSLSRVRLQQTLIYKLTKRVTDQLTDRLADRQPN